MAIVVQSWTVDKSSSGTSLSLTKPTGVAVGDLLLMLCSNDSISDTDQFNAVSGWTKEFEIGSSTSDTHMALYSRIADGTEPSSQTVTMAVSEYALSWYLRIDGHASSGVETIGTESEVASGASVTCPSITTASDNTLVIAWATEGNGNAYPHTVNSGTGWPSAIPSGQTDQEYPSSASQAGVWLTRSVASAGSSNDIIFDISGATSYGKAGIQFAIKNGLSGGQMAGTAAGTATVTGVLGGIMPLVGNIVIPSSWGGPPTPVYTELATNSGYRSTFTESVTVPEGNDRVVMLFRGHRDTERTVTDGSATYDGNAMTLKRTASMPIEVYYYLLGDGVEETKDVVWTADGARSQFQNSVIVSVDGLEQSSPTIIHNNDRAANHASPYEHSLTVTAKENHYITTFESNSASSNTFLKASGSDDFTVKKTLGGTLSSVALGVKEYLSADASKSYIWDTLTSSAPTQNVNQFPIAGGVTVYMAIGVLTDGFVAGAISGTASGSSTVTGILTGTGSLAGTVNGTSTTTGALTSAGNDQISGTASGSATVTGILTAIGELIGAVTGIATVTGLLIAIGILIGSVTGTATVSGTLTGTGELIGTSAGTSTVTGTLTGLGSLAGTSAGSSTVTGTLTSAGNDPISGTASGSATVTGTLTATGELSGTVNGTSTTTGTLTGIGSILGTANGVATVTGLLTEVGSSALVGTASGSATATGVLTGIGELIGTSTGTATVTGVITATGYIEGTASGSASVTGTLSAEGVLSGTASGTATVTGLLGQKVFVVGTASGVATVTGTLIGYFNISGSSAGVATVTGVLTGTGTLEGTSSGVATVTATIIDVGSDAFRQTYSYESAITQIVTANSIMTIVLAQDSPVLDPLTLPYTSIVTTTLSLESKIDVSLTKQSKIS